MIGARRYSLRCAPLMALITFLLCACGDDERLGSALLVTIFGATEAFLSVSEVSAGGVKAGEPTTAGVNLQRVVISLCTVDRKRFLSSPAVDVRVVRRDGSAVETRVERLACRLSKQPGMVEELHLRLEGTGQVNWDFGVSPGVMTYCQLPNTGIPCPVDTL